MARLDRRDRVFFKSNGGSFLGLSIAFVIFIVLLAFCCTSLSVVTRFGLCLNMCLLSFLINIIFDRYGFYVSFVLSFTQLLIYSYEFLVLKKESSVDLAVITLLIIIINIIHGLYLSQILRNIYARKRAESAERTKTITKQMEDDIFARTKLIVSHDPEKQKPATVTKSPAVDTLTTLPGRRMITDRLNRIIEEDLAAMQRAQVPDQVCTHMTIIYTSLDEESLDKLHIGHKSMDLFIQNMAHKLREAAEPEDMVARIYGTEFVILAKRVISAEDFTKYKKKLTEAMSAAFRAADEQMNVAFEFGVSLYPDDGITAEALITKAEEAMTGRVTYGGSVLRRSFFSDMDSASIITMFESAIRNGDFHMVYQPCYRASGELLGYEAFMRWTTSDGKTIRPPDFIRAATKCGYIRRIGNYSLDHSLKTLAKLNATDPELKMNINIATEQLKESSFVMEFSNALSNSNAKIENIVLDINEESLYTDIPEIKASIEKLSSMGVNMALDNFGKGYSSFNAIPLMPIKMLKLDGDFTRELTHDINVRVLVSAAINLMHDIDIKVCATGMGNKEQLDLLKEYGCDFFQGSILGVPVDEDKIDLRS